MRSPHGTGGAGVIVTSQSYAGLGEGADRMIAAAATTVLFQCADPQDLVTRAGMITHYSKSYTMERTSIFPSVRPTREVIRGDDRPRLDPTLVQTLPVGACYLVPSGSYQLVAVTPTTFPQERIEQFRRWVRGDGDERSVFAAQETKPEQSQAAVIQTSMMEIGVEYDPPVPSPQVEENTEQGANDPPGLIDG